MNITSLAVQAETTLATGAWDLNSFLQNAKTYVQLVGGSLLMLMGVAGVVWGVVLLIKNLMTKSNGQPEWGKIILLILIGGAFAVGGWTLASQISSGGQTTIQDLGGGMMLLGL